MKRLNIVILLLLIAFVLTSCADVQHVDACLSGHQYGFWGGLWHGLIAPFSCIGSLIDDTIAVWAINNNGGWYTFGFFLGIGGLSSIGFNLKGNK